MRVLAVVLGLMIAGVAAAGTGSGSGSGGDDIDMDPDPGTGSGSGSATTTTTPTPPPSTGSGSGSGDAGEPAIVKDPKIVKKWLTAAQQLVAKGDYFTSHKKPDDAKAQYTNAITAYQHAIEAGDDVTLYYQLALIEDKVEAEADAYHHLKLVVDAQPPVKADILKKVQTKLDEVTAKVGIVTLTIDPEGTTVSIAGKEYGDSPLKEAVVLMPGTYTASLTLVGYQPKEVELKVEAGATVDKKVTLDPVPIKIVPNKYEPEPEPVVAARPSKLLLIVGASATGAFTIGSVIFGGSAISQHHAYTDPTFTKKERSDAQSLGRTMAHLCDASIGLAVVSAAFTAYWYHWKYQKELDAPPPGYQPREVPKVDMIPWVSPDAGGFAAVGSF
jgi:hypothetical protein